MLREGQSRRGAARLDFEVGRGALSRARTVESDPPSPKAGEVLCAVERFAFSANNVTYALLGERLGYWGLFPAVDGWGRIPVWAYLRVIDSRVDGIAEGRRAFGLGPMSTHALMRPERVSGVGFSDASEHRSQLSSVYNAYSWLDADAAHASELEDHLLVLRPLFWLSFMLDDHLAEEGRLAGLTVLITSASSKAAIGTAHLLAARGVRVVGLTSAANVAFVAGLDLYERVVPYERVAELPRTAAVLVDIAGSRAVRARVERHLCDLLAQTVVAGATHLDTAGSDSEPEGERTVFLFVPARMRRRAKELGWLGLNRRYRAALHDFATDARRWLQIDQVRGRAEVETAYFQVLENATSPDRAHVLTLAPCDS